MESCIKGIGLTGAETFGKIGMSTMSQLSHDEGFRTTRFKSRMGDQPFMRADIRQYVWGI